MVMYKYKLTSKRGLPQDHVLLKEHLQDQKGVLSMVALLFPLFSSSHFNLTVRENKVI